MLRTTYGNEDETFSIPPKTKFLYEDFKSVAETSTYRVYNARARASREWHTIRVFDCTKEYVKANGDNAAALFVQELLWLQRRYPGSVFTNTFEICENGKQMSCATLSYLPLGCQLDESEEIINPKDAKVIEKMLSDVLSDVEFLWKDLQLRKILDTMGPENISFIKEKGRFFLSNWAKILERAPLRDNDLTETVTVLPEESKKKKLSFQDLAAEIKALAFAVLKMNKVEYSGLQSLLALPNLQASAGDAAVKSVLKDVFPDSEKLQELIGKMLSPDLKNLTNLEELRIKEEGNQHSSNLIKSNLVEEESKQLQSKTESFSPNKSSSAIGIYSALFISLTLFLNRKYCFKADARLVFAPE